MSGEGRRTLVACCLLSSVLGSIHSYSLFLDPLEEQLGVGRAAVSSVYSAALLALTGAVLVGHGMFVRLRPSTLVAVVSAGAAVGLLIAGGLWSLPLVLVGYGLLFGGCNGLGYAFALQTAGEANPDRRGLAMGAVTSVYALGAALTGLLLNPLIGRWGAAVAFVSLAAIVLMVGLTASILIGEGSIGRSAEGGEAALPSVGGSVSWFWLGYGLAVLAGLMALGHAAALVDRGDDGSTLSGLAVVIAGLANALGGVVVALGVDRTGHRAWLVGLPIVSVVGLLTLLVSTSAATSVVAVGLVALAYGAVIAVYPVAVVSVFGEALYPVAYGRIFTAWGAAGLIGPTGAGAIFDRWASYSPGLAVAIGAGLMSALVADRLLEA